MAKRNSDDDMVIRRLSGGEMPVQIWGKHIQNPNLSLRAKGLYVYLCSMPTDWIIRAKDLQKKLNQGRAIVRSAMKELRENGYVQYSQIKYSDGTWGPIETHFDENGRLPKEKIITYCKTDTSHRETGNRFAVTVPPPCFVSDTQNVIGFIYPVDHLR